MINAEQIYDKAKSLNAYELQSLTDYLDYLLSKQTEAAKKKSVFTATELETLDTPSIYHGKTLSFQDMQEAIEWETGQSL